MSYYSGYCTCGHHDSCHSDKDDSCYECDCPRFDLEETRYEVS